MAGEPVPSIDVIRTSRLNGPLRLLNHRLRQWIQRHGMYSADFLPEILAETERKEMRQLRRAADAKQRDMILQRIMAADNVGDGSPLREFAAAGTLFERGSALTMS